MVKRLLSVMLVLAMVVPSVVGLKSVQSSEAASARSRAIIYIPGFLTSSSHFPFTTLANRVRDEFPAMVPIIYGYRGVNPYVPIDTTTSVENDVVILKSFFDTLVGQGYDVDIIGHSLGGVIATSFASRLHSENSEKLKYLHAVITLDSPIRGINIEHNGCLEREAINLGIAGPFSDLPVARDLQPDSVVITAIRDVPNYVDVVAIASISDQVIPANTAWLPNAKNVAANTGGHTCMETHGTVYSDSRVLDYIISVLNSNGSKYSQNNGGQSGGSSSIPPPAQDAPGACTNRALFLGDVTIPDGFRIIGGQAFNKTWRWRNDGTCSWNNYRLAFAGSEQMGGPSSVPVPATAPGQTVEVTVPLVAPQGGGAHRGNWQLKTAQGVNVHLGDAYVLIDVIGNASAPPGAGGSGSSDKITLLEISPPSPSDTTSVHMLCRIVPFPDFRSMRFTFGDQIPEMPNFRHVGGLFEISADIDVASMPRGPYAAGCEVSSKSAPDWANAERQARPYTLTGTPRAVGRAPDRPVLKEPYNWYLKDAAGSNASVQLCVHPSNDPDGDPVQYLFEVYLPQGSTSLYNSSGWVSDACWASSLPPNVYSWRAKAGNGGGALSSDWSQETWNFSVASAEVAIGAINFYRLGENDAHICVSVTYGGIIAPNVYAWVNRAADGSESGEWRLLDHYGPNTTPDCTQSDLHGFWIRSPEYLTGTHALKISAIKHDPDNNPVSSKETRTSFTLPFMRPSDFRPVAPSTGERNGTFWNSLTQRFEWTRALRDDQGYQLRVSGSADIWNNPSPLLSVDLPSGTTSYEHTFTQDYTRLYWSVRALNSAGHSDLGNQLWFAIDRVAPTCAVQALPGTAYESAFQVTWGGSDNNAGVRAWDIQAQEPGRGLWTDWLTGIPAGKTTDLFTGQNGHSYAFRCRAADNGGTVGDYPSTADTSTRIDPDARPATPWWDSGFAAKRNIVLLNNMTSVAVPQGYPVRVRFDGTTTPTAAQIYDASQSSPKCNDLRIVANDTTQLDRLVESCTPSLIVLWFRNRANIAGGASDSATHQLYYGNASASNPPAARNNVLYPAIDSATVRAYDMRECSGGTIHDLTGNGNATFSTPLMAWTPNGKFGCALVFPGDAGPDPKPAVDDGTANLPTSAFTAEWWMKLNWVPTPDSIVRQAIDSMPAQWSIVVTPDHGGIRLEVTIHPPLEGISGPGATTVYSNAQIGGASYYASFHHYAVTFDGNTTVRIYIDGNLDSTWQMQASGMRSNINPLRIGASGANNGRLGADMEGMYISNVVRTDFSYGRFAAITTEPSAAAGDAIAPPDTSRPDLAVLNVAAFPNPDGGLLVKADVINQGARNTGSGFFIDLCLTQPTAGSACPDAQRAHFWVASPIDPGAAVTLTTVLTNPTPQASIQAMSALPGAETNATLYVQVDSTNSVTEPDKSNNVSAPLAVCFVNADAFEGDDTIASARLLAVSGAAQTMNIQMPGDQDWRKFTAQAGLTYTFQTSNLGAAADTVLTLYAADGTTVLAQNDDDGASLASKIVWQAPASGDYYVQVRHWNPNAGGCGANYDLAATAVTAVSVRLQPNPALTALNGSPATVDVVVDATTQQLDAVQVRLTFDPSKLQIGDADTVHDGVQVQASPVFQQVLQNTADNTGGVVTFAAGRGTDQAAPSGTFVLATVAVQGQAQGAWPLSFTLSGVQASFGAVTVPVTATDGIVQVMANHLTFTAQPIRGAHGFALGVQPAVTLKDGQGNTVTSDSSTLVTLAIKSGTGAAGAVLTCDQSSDGSASMTLSNGVATFSGCAIGLPGSGYVLEASANGALIGRTAPFNITWAGDTGGDCAVFVLDYSVVVTYFGETSSHADWTDPEKLAFRGDLNGDGQISVVDFSIVVSRFGKTTASCAPASNGPMVQINGSAFLPATLSVHSGESVTWINRDTVAHTVTSDAGLWDSGTLAPGQAFTMPFLAAGSYAYHCAIHPVMTGSIVVQ